MSALYPKEAPVFRVVHPNGAPIPIGEIVVGVDAWGDSLRVLVAIDPNQGASWIDGWMPTWMYKTGDVKPLTPAAEEMLSLVRGGQ